MQEKSKTKSKLKLTTPFPQVEAKGLQKVTCPSCEQSVKAEDINIQDQIAKCGSCDGVFSFAGKIHMPGVSKKVRQELIRPEGIEIFEFRDELEITMQQPFTLWEILVMCIYPLILLSITIGYFEEGLNIMMPLVAWAGGIAFGINVFFRKKQKVHLTIDDKYLSILWQPKKLQRDQSYRIEDIDQIYVKKIDGVHTIFAILNTMKGQKHVKLISRISGISKAHFLEQEIERYLGITDRVVPEES